MDQQTANHPIAKNATSVERKGDRELVVARTFDAPPRIVFKVWSDPDLFRMVRLRLDWAGARTSLSHRGPLCLPGDILSKTWISRMFHI